MASGDVKRSVRVAERVREEVSSLLGRSLSDPRLQGLIVSRVEMTADLQLARVFVRLSQGGDDEQRKAAMRGLQSAASRMRRAIGHNLELRRTPELRFEFDTGMDAQARIEELLREIHDDES